MPVLSIITINFNNKSGLEKTILSVSSQTFNDFEFIVTDGASTDGSAEVIKQNASIISYAISEKDLGIYDAQNKGIKKATGDYLLFLNSGDTLFSNLVISDFYQFIKDKKPGIVYGNSNLIFSDKPNELFCPPKKLSISYFFKNTINHQACFISCQLFSEFGLYDLKYKICADFDLFFKVFVKNPEAYVYFNCTICNYENDGLSSNKENYERVVSEKFEVLKSYLSKKEYDTNYKEYRSRIPLKYRIFERIYKVPVLNWMFKKVYQITKGNA
jgi:glycosyltransferase involved in cell wall biosynthesis